MKYLLIIAYFVPFLAFTQGFNSIRSERKYNKVNLKLMEEIAIDSMEQVIDTLSHKPPSIDFSDRPLLNNAESPVLPVLTFSNPLNNLNVTSNYGMRLHPIKRKWIFHRGVDFSARSDTVKSVLGGIVEQSGYDRKLGYYVKIRHGDYTTIYGHLSKYFVLKDESVSSGDGIGITGSTGLSTGEHLHFSVHYNGNHINPLSFLKRLIKVQDMYAKLNKQYERVTSQSD